MTKLDVVQNERLTEVKEALERRLEKEERSVVILTISSATNEGLQELKHEIFRQLQELKDPEDTGFSLGEPPLITADFLK